METKLNLKKTLIAGLAAGVVSGIINAVLFLIFHSAGVIRDDIFIKPGEAMTIAPVVMASLLPSLLGSLVFFLFEKYTRNGFKIFVIVSIVLALLSLASPFMAIPGVTVGYALVLCVMHLVVPLVLLYFIYRARQRQQSINPAVSF
jgi:hypothetical protein